MDSVDFAEYVANRQRTLLRFAMVLCGDERRAEDIVADVLGRAYEQWGRIGRMDRAHAYVRRMVVNEFLSGKRRERRLVPLEELHDAAVDDHSGPYAERAALLARLATLPPKQRAALALRYYEDLADAEIAATLRCSVGTVRSNISRALATLRVEAREPESGDEHVAVLTTKES